MPDTAERSTSPPVLAVVGPTGVGKSTAALELAGHLNAELVAADAFTVYRGMDIGTAKPSAEDRKRVPHHLTDVLDPSEVCTVSWFQNVGREAIDGILDRGNVPLLVGGSGLYLRALLDPLQFPPTDPVVRQRITDAYRDDPHAAHRHLTDVDPAAAAKIEPLNLRRTVRALEVVALTGQRFSAFRTDWDDYTGVYEPLFVFGLTVPREELGVRVERRLDHMLELGWLDEVRRLREQDFPLSSTAAQAIGYAELLAHLSGELTLHEAIEAIRLRTYRYAVRQERWFRKDPRVRWVSPELLGSAVEELGNG